MCAAPTLTYSGPKLTPEQNKCYGGGRTYQQTQICLEALKAKEKYEKILTKQISASPVKYTGLAAETLKAPVRRMKEAQKVMGHSKAATRAIVRKEIYNETATPETHPGGFLGELDRIGNTVGNFLGDTAYHITQGVGDIINVVGPYFPYIFGALVGGEYIGAAVGGAEAGGTAAAGTGAAAGGTAGGAAGAAATSVTIEPLVTVGATATPGVVGTTAVGVGGAGLAAGTYGLGGAGGGTAAVGTVGTTVLAPPAAGDLAVGGVGLSSLSSSLFSSEGATAGTILSTAIKFLNSGTGIGAFLSSIINFIMATVNDIDKFAKFINTNIIDRFVKPITDVISTVKTLEQTIHDSLAEGFSGIVQIPGEIADAFGSVAAISRLNTKETINAQALIANNIIAKNYPDVAITGLENIHKVLDDYTTLPEIPLSPLLHVDLKEPPNYMEGMAGAADFLHDLKKSKGHLAKFGLALVHILNFLPIWALNMEVATTQGRQEINKAQPLELLNSSDLVTAIIRKEINYSQAEEEALKGGIDPTRLKLLVDISKRLLDPSSIVAATFRGIMDGHDAENEFSRLGYDSQRTKIIRDLYTLLPSPERAIHWFARGGLDEKTLKEIMYQNGVTAEQADIMIKTAFAPVSAAQYTNNYRRFEAIDQGYLEKSLGSKPPEGVFYAHQQNRVGKEEAELNWLAQWDDLGVSDWITAFFRGVIDKEELNLALKAHNIPEELYDFSVAIERELIPIWLVPEILAEGVISDNASHKMLEQLGISDDNIKIIQKIGHVKAAGPLAKHLEALAQLSLSNLKQMFDVGMIDDSQYNKGLTDHGYSDESATLLVKLESIKNELKERRKAALGIIAEINVGVLTEEQGIAKLFNLGLSNGEIAKYTLEIHRVKKARAKLPSQSELNKMLKLGIIDSNEWEKAMYSLGYSPEWIVKLLELTKGGSENV